MQRRIRAAGHNNTPGTVRNTDKRTPGSGGVKLVFLGTAAAQPTASRSMSCMCLVAGGEIVVFDAGEAAQIAYMRSGLGWNKPTKVLITHMHGDHCLGITGLVQTMAMKGRDKPLEVFGPRGIEEFVSSNMRMLNFRPPFPVSVKRVRAGEMVRGRGHSISTCAADHGVEALAYRFNEDARPGRFHRSKAEALGIPEGPLWGRLQRGQNVTHEGKEFSPEDVMDPQRPGISVGISGDTRPTKQLEQFFRGCDVLVFDSTFADDRTERAEQTRHSTAAEAGRLARDAGVKRLVLTHFSARYPDVGPLREQAGRFHDDVTAAEDMGEVELRHDS